MPRSDVASCPLKLGIIREGLTKEKVFNFIGQVGGFKISQLLLKATGDLGSPY